MTIKYLLDTNIISEVNKIQPDPLVVQHFEQYQSKKVATATLVIHELLYGCLRLPLGSVQRNFLFDYIREISLTITVLAYDLQVAQWHAEERVRLSKFGKTPAFVDSQIASIAFVNNLILVTRNIKDFESFQGLNRENWFEN